MAQDQQITDQDRQQFSALIKSQEFLSAPPDAQQKQLLGLSAIQKAPYDKTALVQQILGKLPKAAPAAAAPPQQSPGMGFKDYAKLGSALVGAAVDLPHGVLSTPISKLLGGSTVREWNEKSQNEHNKANPGGGELRKFSDTAFNEGASFVDAAQTPYGVFTFGLAPKLKALATVGEPGLARFIGNAAKAADGAIRLGYASQQAKQAFHEIEDALNNPSTEKITSAVIHLVEAGFATKPQAEAVIRGIKATPEMIRRGVNTASNLPVAAKAGAVGFKEGVAAQQNAPAGGVPGFRTLKAFRQGASAPDAPPVPKAIEQAANKYGVPVEDYTAAHDMDTHELQTKRFEIRKQHQEVAAAQSYNKAAEKALEEAQNRVNAYREAAHKKELALEDPTEENKKIEEYEGRIGGIQKKVSENTRLIADAKQNNLEAQMKMYNDIHAERTKPPVSAVKAKPTPKPPAEAPAAAQPAAAVPVEPGPKPVAQPAVAAPAPVVAPQSPTPAGQTPAAPALTPSTSAPTSAAPPPSGPIRPPVKGTAAAATVAASAAPAEAEDARRASPYAKPGPYITALPPDQEAQFQSWVKKNKVPFDPSPNADYDMRGYWQANKGKLADTQMRTDGLHFPDTFKTPYHKTFSNESKYATPDAPHWQGDKLYDKSWKMLTDETSTAIQPKKVSSTQAPPKKILAPVAQPKPVAPPLNPTAPKPVAPKSKQAPPTAARLAEDEAGNLKEQPHEKLKPEEYEDRKLQLANDILQGKAVADEKFDFLSSEDRETLGRLQDNQAKKNPPVKKEATKPASGPVKPPVKTEPKPEPKTEESEGDDAETTAAAHKLRGLIKDKKWRSLSTGKVIKTLADEGGYSPWAAKHIAEALEKGEKIKATSLAEYLDKEKTEESLKDAEKQIQSMKKQGLISDEDIDQDDFSSAWGKYIEARAER